MATIGISSLLPVTLIATDFFAITTLLSVVVCLKDKKYSPPFNCFFGTATKSPILSLVVTNQWSLSFCRVANWVCGYFC